ncbi:MAG: histidine--tRNA ligase [Anaerolineae bacterium]
MYTAPRGTVDILPEDQPYWDHLRRCIDETTALFGYGRIEVPCFEETSLFVRGVGTGTDIVDKEMYSFQDKGGRDITLRPEFTAGVVRAYLEHGMKTWPQPVKLFTIGPIFRYERVQAGRYRQHTQFDIECIGSQDPAVDVEVMSVAWHLYARLGFSELAFQLNSTGCPVCRPGYLQVLVAYYQGQQERICDDCRRRLERNPLRLLDCKEERCQPVIAAAPKIGDHLCQACHDHFAQVRHYLDALERPYTINHRLVRGLDYYTKTVFEVWAAGIGAQNAVCGGGRYDGLAEQLGGDPTPGIGFGSGMERLVLTMKEQGIEVPASVQPQVSLVYHGSAAKVEAVRLMMALRERGMAASMTYDDRSFRAQFRGADRDGARYALVLGEQELEAGEVVVHPMLKDAEEERVPLENAVEHMARLLA